MTFRDLRQGQTVYLLHKGEEMSAGTARVRSAGIPRFPEYGTTGNAMGMVVDVVVEDVDGGQKTYVVPADSMIASAGNVVISVDKAGVLREVEALRTESEEAIEVVEKHKKRKEECERIMAEWDERKAEKKEQDERIGKIEGKVDGLAEMIKGFIKEFKGE